MADIYELHSKAFAKVAAYVICRDGEGVGTVAIKFPADGAGRLWAYVHLLGASMVRAQASGYGYDKRSAAVQKAISLIPVYGHSDYDDPNSTYARAYMVNREALQAACKAMDAEDWQRTLEKQGFTVLQAV